MSLRKKRSTRFGSTHPFGRLPSARALYLERLECRALLSYSPALSLAIVEDPIAENATEATGVLTRSGMSFTQPLTISLATSDAGLATVPATVEIPAGQTSATFPIYPIDNGVPDGPRSLTITASAQAEGPLVPDPAFGGGSIDVPFFVSGMALDSAGRLVASGMYRQPTGGDIDFAVARYLSDGALDTTFGTNGMTVSLDFDANRPEDRAQSLVILPDGKIVVGGIKSSAGFGSYRWLELRGYNADGTPDDGSANDSTPGDQFGTAGKVVWSPPGSAYYNELYDLALQTVDGQSRIIAAGCFTINNTTQFGVARFTPGGALDTTFGPADTGYVRPNVFSTGANRVFGVAVQSDGKIVLGGTTAVDFSSSRFAVLRLTDDGALDTTFGSIQQYGPQSGPLGPQSVRLGWVETDLPGSYDEAHELTIQPDGKILAIGRVSSGVSTRNNDLALARYTAEGDLDTSFGSGGVVQRDFGGNNDIGLGAVVLPGGQILVNGQSGASGVATLWRYEAAGVLDDHYASSRPGSGDEMLLVNGTALMGGGSSWWSPQTGFVIALDTDQVATLTASDASAIKDDETNSAPVAVGDDYTVSEDGTLATIPATAASRLVLRYDFDELAGGAFPAADSGRVFPPLNGDFAGGATRTSDTPAGQSRGALDLAASGQNSTLSAGDADKVDTLTAVTIAMWINLQGQPNVSDVLMSNRPASSPLPAAGVGGWQWRIAAPSSGTFSAANMALEFELAESNGSTMQSSVAKFQNPTVPLNADHRWAFVAVSVTSGARAMVASFRGSTSTPVTLLGSEVVLTSGLGRQNQADLRIGLPNDASPGAMATPAWFDDVRVYDRVLTIPELELIRQESLAQHPPAGVLANDTDVDNDRLAAVLDTGPQHGNLTLYPDGSFTYVPQPNYNGPDGFTYRASDGVATSDPATVNLTVTPVNDAPTAANQQVATDEDSPLAVTLTGADIDGDPLTYSVVNPPAHGTLTGTAPDLVYTPWANYNGADAFTFRANDGTVNSNVATVSVTVNPVNDPPTAVDDAFTVKENEDLVIGAITAPADLVLRYSFDDAFDANTPANDTGAVPPALDGTLVGQASRIGTGTPGGFSAGALDLSQGAGTSSYVSAGDADKVDALTAVTGTAWINLRASPSLDDRILSNERSLPTTDTQGWDWRFDGGSAASFGLRFEVRNGSLGQSQGITGFSANQQWAFVAFTYSNANHEIHMFQGSESSAVAAKSLYGTMAYNIGPSNTADLRLGGTQAQTGDRTPPAWFDDLRIYNRVLTLTELDRVRVENLAETFGGVLSNDTDIEGQPLTAALVTGPQHGALTLNANGSFTYSPDPDFYGTDSFTYRANDGQLDSDAATVTITVTPGNRAPVANDGSVTTAEDASAPVTLIATDINGDALTYAVVASPQHGTLTGTAPNLTYTPAANYYGPDSFTFKANDGVFDSNVATVSITVTPVNDAPVAIDDRIFTTDEDTALTVSAPGVLWNDHDADGDALTAVLVSGPSHGGVALNADGSFTYTPAANYNGSDSFTYKVNDGNVDSGVATVSIPVAAVNDPPVANDDAYEVDEDGSLAVGGQPSSIAGLVLRYGFDEAESGAAPASDTGAPPAADGAFVGSATRTGNSPGGISTGALDLTPGSNVNNYVSDGDARKVDDLLAMTATFWVNLRGNPSVGDALVSNMPEYPPWPPSGVSTSGWDLKIAAPAGGGAPTASNFRMEFTTARIYNNLANAQGAYLGPFNANNQWVFVAITFADNGGFASFRGGELTSVAQIGALTFAYDLTGWDNPADLRVGGSAHDPSADRTPPAWLDDVRIYNRVLGLTELDAVRRENLTAIGVLTNDTDPEVDALSAILVAEPSHGTVALNADGSFSYTPDPDFNGTDEFTYKANDGQLDSNVATVSITVTPVNDAPVASDGSATTAEDTAVSITLAGSDVEGSALTYTVASGPQHGTLTGTAPNLTYTPNANYNGPDSFAFRANDGQLDSNVATVSITVTPVNDAPVASDGSAATAEDTAVSITLAGSDVEGSALTYTVDSAPQHGTLTVAAPNLIYTPDANYNGPDSFTFRANDGQLDSNVATVSITVTPVNDAPVASDGSAATAEDTPVSITLAGSDVDGSELTYTVVSVPQHGTLTGAAPSLIYTPDANYNGPDSFTFTVNDGQLDSNVAAVTITVAPVNDAPVVTVTVSGPASATPGQLCTFVFDASDPLDGDPTGQQFLYSITWDDGTSEPVSGGSLIEVQHEVRVVRPSGTYMVTATVTDEGGSGLTSVPASLSIGVFGAGIQGNDLVVVGTSGSDSIQIKPVDTSGNLTVLIGGQGQGEFHPTGWIMVYALAGDDTVQVQTLKIGKKTVSVTVPAAIFGAEGADVLDVLGSKASNILVGGDGDDAITATSGRDLLFGGLGADILRGGSGEDILVAGSSVYDADLAALRAIWDEWTRTDADYPTRVGHLRGTIAGGHNQGHFLTTSTVFDDSAVDQLFGESGTDWFFYRSSGDFKDVHDRKRGEETTLLDPNTVPQAKLRNAFDRLRIAGLLSIGPPGRRIRR